MSSGYLTEPSIADRSKHATDDSAWQWPGRAQLSGREWQRRLLHMFPAVWPLTEPLLPAPENAATTALMCGLVAMFSTLVWLRFSAISRDGERSILPSVLGYSGTVIALLILFPHHRELAMTALVVMALGDGSATMGGLLFRGPRLPWNPNKRWAGLISFVACSGPIASLVYFLGMPSSQPAWVALLAGFLAAVMGAFVESLKSKLNDNIRVGAVLVVVLVGLHLTMSGYW